jgi:hypothetical protein
VPLLQAAHDGEAAAAANRPAMQSAQEALPLVGDALPAGHGMHVEEVVAASILE